MWALFYRVLFTVITSYMVSALLMPISPHKKFKQNWRSCYQPAGTVKASVILAFLPKKQNKLFSQPASSLPSGIRSKTVWTLPYGSRHGIVSFHQEATQGHFLSLIYIFLLSPICFREHKSFFVLFCLSACQFPFPRIIFHSFPGLKGTKHSEQFVYSRFDIAMPSIQFLFAFVWCMYVCSKQILQKI